jgi:hypothetical protein
MPNNRCNNYLTDINTYSLINNSCFRFGTTRPLLVLYNEKSTIENKKEPVLLVRKIYYSSKANTMHLISNFQRVDKLPQSLTSCTDPKQKRLNKIRL